MTRISRAIVAVLLSLWAIGYPPMSLAQADLRGPRIVGRDPGAGAGWGTSLILALNQNALVFSIGSNSPFLPAIASIGLVSDGISAVGSVTRTQFWLDNGISDEPDGRKRVVLGERLLAQHITPEGGAELWSLDAATGTWTLSGEMIAGPIGGEPRLMTVTRAADGTPGTRVYFAARDATFRERVWQSDGTAAGTSPVLPYGTEWAFAPLGTDMMVVGHALDTSETVLWRADASTGGPGAVLASWPGAFPGSMVSTPWGVDLAVSGGPTLPGGTALWTSDGTSSGTVSLGTVPGRAVLLAASEEAAGPRYLRAYVAGGLNELWSFTPGVGAVRLTDSFASIDAWAEATSLSGRRRLVFTATANDAAAVRELWVSDGTFDGTQRLSAPGVIALGEPRVWCSDHGLVYFTGTEPQTGSELWRTDGTPAGTGRLTDLAPGPGSSNPHHAAVVKSRLYFGAVNGLGVDEVWTIDLCPADFNNGGVVGVQDLFDFLAAYFGANIRADINGSHMLSVQDLFD